MAKRDVLVANLDSVKVALCDIIAEHLEVVEFNGSAYYGIPWNPPAEGQTKGTPKRFRVGDLEGQITTVFNRVEVSKEAKVSQQVAAMTPAGRERLLQELLAQQKAAK